VTNSSSAGNATVITNPGGTTSFSQFSTGGNAAFITQAGGVFDMSGVFFGMTAGSIAGQGTYFLGSNALVVGGNNLSTTVDGTISDGGLSGGTGGSLVKVGAGTLTLAGSIAIRAAPSSMAARSRSPAISRRRAGGGGPRRHARRDRDDAGRVGGRRNFGAGPANRHRHAQRQGQPRIHVRRHLPHQHQRGYGEPDQRYRDRDTQWSDRPGRRRQGHHQATGLHLVDGNGRCQRDLQPRCGWRKEQGRSVL